MSLKNQFWETIAAEMLADCPTLLICIQPSRHLPGKQLRRLGGLLAKFEARLGGSAAKTPGAGSNPDIDALLKGTNPCPAGATARLLERLAEIGAASGGDPVLFKRPTAVIMLPVSNGAANPIGAAALLNEKTELFEDLVCQEDMRAR